MDFKKKSRPFFIIIFKLKNCNFKTRDFSPLIERVLAGVNTRKTNFLFLFFSLTNENPKTSHIQTIFGANKCANAITECDIPRPKEDTLGFHIGLLY